MEKQTTEKSIAIISVESKPAGAGFEAIASTPDPSADFSNIKSFKNLEILPQVVTSKSDPAELLSHLDKVNPELVLLSAPGWKATDKALANLVFGYESGARATVARRSELHQGSKASLILERFMIYLFFGAKRYDPSSPIRLYDVGAFKHILGVLENVYKATGQNFLAEFCLLSALEHFFTFSSYGVEIVGFEDVAPSAPNKDLFKMVQKIQQFKDAIRKYRDAKSQEAKY